jgi:hypothetical protein
VPTKLIHRNQTQQTCGMPPPPNPHLDPHLDTRMNAWRAPPLQDNHEPRALVFPRGCSRRVDEVLCRLSRHKASLVEQVGKQPITLPKYLRAIAGSKCSLKPSNVEPNVLRNKLSSCGLCLCMRAPFHPPTRKQLALDLMICNTFPYEHLNLRNACLCTRMEQSCSP